MYRGRLWHNFCVLTSKSAESGIFMILAIGCTFHFFAVGFRYWTYFPQAVQIPGEYARWDDPINFKGIRTVSEKYPMYAVPLELPPEY